MESFDQATIEKIELVLDLLSKLPPKIQGDFLNAAVIALHVYIRSKTDPHEDQAKINIEFY